MPKLFVEFDLTGTITAISVEQKILGGVAYRHLEPGPDGRPQLKTIPDELTLAIAWAVDRCEDATSAVRDQALAEAFGVPLAKLADVKAAIADAKK